MVQMQEDQEARITSLEKSLKAEKTLNKLLEDSLAALEGNMESLSRDCAAWRQRSTDLETEVKQLRERPPQTAQADPANRLSLMAVEEERRKRQAAEAAQARAEERMQALSAKKKKNKASLNCF